MSFSNLGKAIREIHSEATPNGNILSWGRVASSFALLAAIVWITKVLIFTRAIPALDGVTGFVLAPYTANKISSTVQSFSNAATVNAQNSPPGTVPNKQ